MTQHQRIGGRYELLEEIGAGGMGTVFKGLDHHTQTYVAVKVLPADIAATSPVLLERFQRESDTLRALNHPNIVKMLTTVSEQGSHYLIMEYVGGGSLKHHLLLNRHIQIKHVLRIGLGVADALTRTHELGIIHRDVKPSNILITEGGTPRLTDFGVAQTTESNLTKTGTLMGTVLYLSPEAFRRFPLDERTDIWSFGVTLFEMLTGERPYTGDTMYDVMEAVLHTPIPDIERLRPDAPSRLIDLVYRMLTHNREARIATMREVGAELEDVLRGLPATSPRLQIASHLANITNAADEGLRFAQPHPIVGADDGFLPDIEPFHGRERDLRELQSMLSEQGMVAVWGQAGVGKTRLICQLKTKNAYYIDLRGIKHTETVASQIAAQIGCTVRPKAAKLAPSVRLAEFLRYRHVLLVLDHADEWHAGSAWLQSLRDDAGYDGVRVVLAQRNRPNLPDTHLLELAPFAYREFKKRRTANEYPITSLFMSAIGRGGYRYTLRDDDVQGFNAILAATGGNPAALQIAALGCQQRSMQAIADHISKAYAYFRTEYPDGDEGLLRVRAAFDAMSDLLEKPERDAMLQLSIFRGKFSSNAAQSVAEEVSIHHLRTLTDRGLLQRYPDGTYMMLPALADSIAPRLHEMVGLLEAAWRGYENYYANFARRYKYDLRGFRQQHALVAFRQRFANLSRAWESMWTNGSDRTMSRIINVLFNYLWLDDRWKDGELMFEPAIERFMATDTNANLNMITKLMNRGGLTLAMNPGRADEANNLLIEGLRIARQRRLLEEMSLAQYGLGLLVDDTSSGIELLTESMRAAHDAPDRFLEARATITLSEFYARSGRIDKFDELNQQATHLAQEMRDKHTEMHAIHSLSRYADTDGEHKLAIQAERDLLEYYRSIGDSWNAVNALHNITMSYFKRGRLDQAMSAAQEADAAADSINDFATMWAVNALEGYIATVLDDRQRAMTIVEEVREGMDYAPPYVRARIALLHTRYALMVVDDVTLARVKLAIALEQSTHADAELEADLAMLIGAAVLQHSGQNALAAGLLGYYMQLPTALRWLDRDPLAVSLRNALDAAMGDDMMLALQAGGQWSSKSALKKLTNAMQ